MTSLTVNDGKPFNAGFLLMQEQKTQPFLPAGKVLMSLGNENEKIDCEVTIEDILQEVEEINLNRQNKKEFKEDEVDSCVNALVHPQAEDDFKYKMDHNYRGCFMIFNQEHFDAALGLERRTGTRTDAYNMYLIAKAMGFEFIRTFHDFTRNEILNYVKQVSECDHSSYDTFGFAILTHGEEDGILYAKDAPFKLSDCTNLFTADKCPSLAQKPKIFFIQACRGSKFDSGSNISSSLRLLANPMKKFPKVPNHADFLIAYSTVPGYMSWRNKANGSWFVQALHVCFTTYGHHLELMQIMTRVNREVALYFESNTDGDLDGCKQIPSITSQLTANVYFHKKGFEPYSCPLCLKVSVPETNRSDSVIKTPGTPVIEPVDEKRDKKRRNSVGTWLRKSLRRRR